MGYLILIILLFIGAIGQASEELRKNDRKEKSLRFWVVQPFISPILLTIGVVLSRLIKIDIVGYYAIVILLLELVFYILKKKRKRVFFLVIPFVIAIILAIISFYPRDGFAMDAFEDCSITYYSDGKLVTKEIDPVDGEKLYTLLNGNEMFSENLSCGFGPDAAIRFNDASEFVYLAQDGCKYFYSANDEKFISVGREKRTIIYEILMKYGMHLPSFDS